MVTRIRPALSVSACASVLAAALAAPGAPVATASTGSGGSGGIAAGGFSVHAETATFPLHRGRTTGGRRFWYITVEASDSSAADRFGVRVVNKLRNAAGTDGVDHG